MCAPVVVVKFRVNQTQPELLFTLFLTELDTVCFPQLRVSQSERKREQDARDRVVEHTVCTVPQCTTAAAEAAAEACLPSEWANGKPRERESQVTGLI